MGGDDGWRGRQGIRDGGWLYQISQAEIDKYQRIH